MSYPLIPGQLSLADVLPPVVSVTRRCYGSPREWRIDYANGYSVRIEKGDRSGYYRVNGHPQVLAAHYDALVGATDSND